MRIDQPLAQARVCNPFVGRRAVVLVLGLVLGLPVLATDGLRRAAEGRAGKAPGLAPIRTRFLGVPLLFLHVVEAAEKQREHEVEQHVVREHDERDEEEGRLPADGARCVLPDPVPAIAHRNNGHREHRVRQVVEVQARAFLERRWREPVAEELHANDGEDVKQQNQERNRIHEALHAPLGRGDHSPERPTRFGTRSTREPLQLSQQAEAAERAAVQPGVKGGREGDEPEEGGQPVEAMQRVAPVAARAPREVLETHLEHKYAHYDAIRELDHGAEARVHRVSLESRKARIGHDDRDHEALEEGRLDKHFKHGGCVPDVESTTADDEL